MEYVSVAIMGDETGARSLHRLEDSAQDGGNVLLSAGSDDVGALPWFGSKAESTLFLGNQAPQGGVLLSPVLEGNPKRMASAIDGMSSSNIANAGSPDVVWGDVAEAEQTITEPFRKEDDDVVQRVLAGDRDAFEELVRRYSPRVFNIIGSFFHHRDTVEDIAQEVFVKAYTSLASYTLGRSFEAWVARIAVNCCYDHLRTLRKRGEQVAPQADESEGEWLDLQMVEAAIARHSSSERQREAADIASRLLARLTPEDRLVLVLMDRDGFSVRDVAEMTGWGPSKVKVRAFRARRTLRAAMKRMLAASERKRRNAENE